MNKNTNKTSRRVATRSVKKKTRSASTPLTVNTNYARVALVLLALNVLFTGYVIAKLSNIMS
tara:strand:+ start:3236 stop:3421 length:186 start_codon:yes stop_codon:yes gene_type:complete